MPSDVADIRASAHRRLPVVNGLLEPLAKDPPEDILTFLPHLGFPFLERWRILHLPDVGCQSLDTR